MIDSTQSPTPLIPRELLFGNPVKAAAQISPDGSQLAYLAPDEGVLNVWLKTVGQDDDRVITRDRDRGIRSFQWAYDGSHLLYEQDSKGDENWHVYSVQPETGIIRDLTPFQDVQAGLLDLNHEMPDSVLVSMNLRNPQLHEVFRVTLSTGGTELVQENPGDIVGWVVDAQQQVRAGQAALPDGGFELRVKGLDSEEFAPMMRWSPEDEGHPYAFMQDGKSLYLGNSLGSDTVELRLLDLTSRQEATLASNPKVDLADVLFHPTKHEIQAVGFNDDRLRWETLDDGLKADFTFLENRDLGEFHIVSRTLDDQTWIVLFVSDRASAAYYCYSRIGKELEFLFTTRPDLERYALSGMRALEIETRDGLRLNSYLTLPTNADPKGLPLVLNVHGGPWARDSWGYDPEAQWLANRGYACLQVNFRGSTGFGKKFLHAADREWGAKMHDDLLDAVQWAVDEGIADPKRICIYGGSYGGYAALVGAAFTPDVFSCAVDIVGPSSLQTLINSIPPYWEPLKHVFRVRVGDIDTEPDFLDSRSPLFKADQIVCPLLIAQGANDPRVKQAESEQIVKALRDRGKEVEYMLFEDEGHGFAKPENRLKFYAAAEVFLGKHLGGRVEP